MTNQLKTSMQLMSLALLSFACGGCADEEEGPPSPPLTSSAGATAEQGLPEGGQVIFACVNGSGEEFRRCEAGERMPGSLYLETKDRYFVEYVRYLREYAEWELEAGSLTMQQRTPLHGRVMLILNYEGSIERGQPRTAFVGVNPNEVWTDNEAIAVTMVNGLRQSIRRSTCTLQDGCGSTESITILTAQLWADRPDLENRDSLPRLEEPYNGVFFKPLAVDPTPVTLPP